MCGLFGMMTGELTEAEVSLLSQQVALTRERGTDGIGWAIFSGDLHGIVRSRVYDRDEFEQSLGGFLGRRCIIIGNVRAEPTTEWFDGELTREQGHPFANAKWTVVHNGTIANDNALVDSGYEKCGSPIDSAVLPSLFEQEGFADGLREVLGSYAVLAYNHDTPGSLHIATNYKPLYTVVSDKTRFFSSQERFLHPEGVVALPQYEASEWLMLPNGSVGKASVETMYAAPDEPTRVIVIASGGLDSTVAAKEAVDEYGAENVTLLHFTYGCRAQTQEMTALAEISESLRVEVEFLDVEPLFRTIASTSPLLDDSQGIRTDGDAGAEYAYEWVPARNLIFLSIATAMAENEGAELIYTGTNLEESGAYPDNEPEFINRFNHLLPYAVADGKRVRIVDAVGNLMKHQIVKRGLDIGAPLELTWSCYYGNEQHCGECGPCKMRRTAFTMNKEVDPVEFNNPASIRGA